MKQKEEQSRDVMIEQTADDLIWLCSCAVNGKIPNKARIEKMDLASVYKLAEEHMLTAVAAYALEAAGVSDKAFIQIAAKAIRKMAVMDAEQEKVLEQLEKAGIRYMPLKGAILKDIYPEYGIRQMSDRDILIDSDRVDDVRKIMTKLGYTTEKYDEDYHDCYTKLPVSNFEMHRRLVSPMNGKVIYSYYLDVERLLQKDTDNAYGYHLSDEDFYIFLIVHEYKHYSERGTGLRSLLDTYVYLKKKDLNMDYIKAEVEKLGIAGYEQANRSLALNLFEGKDLTDENMKMLEYVLSCGTYGKAENQTKNLLAEKGRKGYFLSRLTLPYARMVEIYPVLKKAPVLYPFCWIHRLVHAFLFKNKKVMYQLKAGLTWKENK
jgi:hypothetical protein